MPFAIGDRVMVHGEGFGEIVGIVERDVNPYAVVAIPRRYYHEPSRRTMNWKERVSVSLDVYPAHMSRSAA